MSLQSAPKLFSGTFKGRINTITHRCCHPTSEPQNWEIPRIITDNASKFHTDTHNRVQFSYHSSTQYTGIKNQKKLSLLKNSPFTTSKRDLRNTVKVSDPKSNERRPL